MNSVKQALHCLLLTILCAIGVKAYLTIGPAQEAIIRASLQAEQALMETRAAVAEWKEYSRAARVQFDDPQVRRGVGLLLRSGDDLARTVKKANVLLDDTRDAIRDTSENINSRLVPAALVAIEEVSGDIHNTLDNTDRALEATIDAVEQISVHGELLTQEVNENLAASKRAIEALEARTTSPQLTATMFHVQQAAEDSALTARRVEKLTRPLAWIGGGLKKIGKGIRKIF
jgi:methyl-accepting chemotaxis protein